MGSMFPISRLWCKLVLFFHPCAMKKIIPSVFFLVFSMSAVSFATAEELQFSDLDSGDENYNAIYFLHNTGVIEGYENEDGSRDYRPDQDINRAEFLKIILEGSFMASGASYESCFPDVDGEAWYATYVCEAKEEGWIQGYPDGFFKPEQTINEAEALKILGNVVGWEVDSAAEGEEWYQPYLDLGEAENLVPVDDVSALMSRGDIAELIYRSAVVSVLALEEYSQTYDEAMFLSYGLTYEGSSTGEYSYGSISQSGSVTVGDTVTVMVELFDEYAEPVSGHLLEAVVTKPSSYDIFDLEEEGNGVYSLELSSYMAATYGVYVRDLDTGEIYYTYAQFLTGEAVEVELLNELEPYENEDHSGTFEAVLRDEYGNVVLDDEEAVDFSSDMGSLSTSYDEDSGVWNATLSAGEVGEATVTVSGPGSNRTATFAFDSVLVGAPRAVAEGDSFTVPVYVNMGDEGSLASYDLSIAYNSGFLQFNDAEDGDSSDDFDGPSVSLAGDSIRLNQVTNTGAATEQYVHVADLLFDGIAVGSGVLYAEDATLTTTNEVPVQNLLLQQAAVPQVTVKSTKIVCIDAYLLEGADDRDGTPLTAQDIQSRFITAELAFGVGAASCNCPHYLEFNLNIIELARDEWQPVTVGAGTDAAPAPEDDVVEDPESDLLSEAFDREGCIPMFFVPQIAIPDAAVVDWQTAAWSDMDPRHISVDSSRDNFGNSVTHELMHNLSNSEVLDYDPKGTAQEISDAHGQGAQDPGNVMNYSDPGFEMTVNQCSLIDWDALPDR